MKEIFAKDVIRLCDGKIVYGKEDVVLNNFINDTREIKDNNTYIGIKGEKHDGSTMYKEALKNGAKVCILQESSISTKLDIQEIKEKYSDSTIILVKNTIEALQKLAAYKRSLYDIPVVAITGSVGKTSTKDIIASVMAKKFNVLKTIGNYNSQIGLPLTVLRLKEHDAMVVEMGMSNLGEISNLTKIANPTVAVITNVGTAHIGILGSRENILKAKMEILEGLRKDGTLVINYDNDMLHDWKERNDNFKYKVITYGMENKSDIMPYDVVLSEKGSTYKIDIEGKTYNVNIAVGGNHFVLNSLCAISVGRLFNIKIEDILDGIANFELTKRRMEIKKDKNGITIINDCYNANYDSVKAALEYLGKINANRKIAVLGDMLELGQYSKMLHQKVGEEVAINNIDILITVGELSEDIANKAKESGIKEIYMCKRNDEAIKLLKKLSKNGDAILLKASNSMNFQEIFNNIFIC